LASKGTVTGASWSRSDDAAFDDAVQNCTIFARISPSRKLRLVTRRDDTADRLAS
jgi:Mg2+-importing ATPase